MDTPWAVSEISRSPIRAGEKETLSGKPRMKAVVYRGSKTFAANKEEAGLQPRELVASARDLRFEAAPLMQVGDER